MRRFFLPADLAALSPGDRFRFRLSRILAVASVVFLLPLSSRLYGFPMDVPPGGESARLQSGERVWMTRETASIAAGDLVVFRSASYVSLFGEVLAVEGDPVHGERVVDIRSNGLTFRICESEIQGRASLVYRPVSHLRRVPRSVERSSP